MQTLTLNQCVLIAGGLSKDTKEVIANSLIKASVAAAISIGFCSTGLISQKTLIKDLIKAGGMVVAASLACSFDKDLVEAYDWMMLFSEESYGS